MTEVEARRIELESRRMEPGLTVMEANEVRDCEIALGMVMASQRTRAEAARRVEQYAAAREASLRTRTETARLVEQYAAARKEPAR